MRILYLDQYFSTRSGISGTRGYEFAKRMVAQGHKVTVITSASKYSSLYPQREFIRRLAIEGINVISIRISYSHMMGWTRRLWSFASYMVIAAVLGVIQPRHDVVFATSTPLSIGFPGLMVTWIRGTPLVFEVRDLWPRAPVELGIIKNRAAIWLLNRFERLIYSNSKGIVALSPGMKQGIIEKGMPEEKVTIIPNAADSDMFEGLPAKKELRKQLGLENVFTAVYAGTVGLANGLPYLVDIAEICEKQHQANIRFLVIGQGNDLENIKRLAKEKKLSCITFLGPMGRSEVAKYITTSDLGLTLFADLPVLKTNSPNKFFDYMAAGIAGAVNNDGWTAGLLKENQAGLYLPVDDPETAAQMILSLAKDGVACKRMGRNSKDLAMKQFERGGLVQKLLVVLKSASGKKTRGLEYGLKGLFDFAFAVISLVVFSPAILAIAAAIKLDSPGPVFFKQERAGRLGKKFMLYKFRTMVHGAAQMGLGLNVEQDDERITKVGRFLRDWSLDELPQLFNLLRLQMSLIGPRPALPEQVKRYDGAQRKRLLMLPGLTGLAQVSGRNLLTWEQKLAKDVQYVEEFSLLLDAKIFLKTFRVVLKKEGLYEPDAGLDDDFNKEL